MKRLYGDEVIIKAYCMENGITPTSYRFVIGYNELDDLCKLTLNILELLPENNELRSVYIDDTDSSAHGSRLIYVSDEMFEDTMEAIGAVNDEEDDWNIEDSEWRDWYDYMTMDDEDTDIYECGADDFEPEDFNY